MLTPTAPLLAVLLTLIGLLSPGCTGSRSASRLAPAPTDGWVSLFDGRTLEGWVQRGGAADYEVRAGELVGISRPGTPNSFLCTERTYTNFVLELEFWVHPRLNSGVQIRSQVFDTPTEVKSGERTHRVPAGRVHGIQVEIDPSSRAWSGGLFEEGARGWLANLQDNPAARAAFRNSEWNHFRIDCDGDRIQTWINGVPAADLRDDRVPAGFIALQVHGVGTNAAPREVRFRNLRIQER